MHTILANKNKIYVSGRNYSGQLGLGHTKNKASPQLLTLEQEISQIACGANHTIILGVNLVGLGSYASKSNASKSNASKSNASKSNASKSNASKSNASKSNASKSYHDVLVFGYNSYGQLGLGHWHNQNKPQLLSVKATLLPGILTYPEWRPERHFIFLSHFRVGIYTFLLVHKRFSLRTRVKIPKFVLFEIFKRCVPN